MNNITRIQLVEGQTGFLNVKEGTNFPLNKSIGDIRDLSKRTGSFTKEITLTGDKNNNQLLNNYFDVNVQAATFDVNKRQKCIIIQNGVVILDNAYLRLLKVEKVQSVGNETDDFVEYVVQVRDTLGDFFKEINNKELIDLRGFSQFNHIYTKGNVIDTFNNTVVDGYKYVLPYIDNTEFNIQELLPGIYAKQYWDKIHQQAGYSYEWAALTSSTVNFDKLIVPYSGDKKKLSEDYKDSVRVIADSTASTQTNLASGNGVGKLANIPLAKVNIQNEIKDPQDFYNQITSLYENVFSTYTPDSLDYQIDINFDLIFVNSEAQQVYFYRPNSGAAAFISPRVKITNQLGNIKGEDRLRFTSINTANPTVNNICSLVNDNKTLRMVSTPFTNSGNLWGVGETVAANGVYSTTIQSSNIAIGDLLKVIVDATVNDTVNNVFNITNTTTPANMYARLRVNSIKINITPNSDNGILVNGPVLMESLVPRKIKQSDFLKSIYQKYNLFVEVDPINPNKLIYTSRDEYYDSGAVRDLTQKLDKGQKQQLQFVPEISSKKLILSYKDDSNDPLLESYRGETSQTYGQVEITFDNENVRGLERKDEIFSPTLNVDSDFGANLPVLAADFKYNIRLLYDGGELECQPYTIKAFSGSSITVNTYPFLSMVDRPENPTFDISYAQPEYYSYDIINGTENNMYTNHWRRTLAQINSGKLLTAYFWLTEEDIANIKLNDKIKVNNALWYINAIIDYDANAKKPTKVELLSVEDDLKLPTFGTNNVKPGTIIATLPRTPKPLGPTKPYVKPLKEVLAVRKIQGGVIGYTGADVQGMNAIVNSGFRGSVLGDNVRASEDGHYVNNDIKMTTDGVFVDGTSQTKDGFRVGDTFINNSGMTYNSSYYDFGYIDEDYFESDTASVYFTTGSTIVLDGTVNLTTIGSGTSVSNLGVDANGNIVYGAGGSSTFTGGTVTGPTTFTDGVTANTFTGAFFGDGSGLTGITTDDFYTTGATLVGSTVVFDRNDTLSAYTVDLSGLEFTGQTLAQTLAIGNTTGGNDIITSNDDVIKAATGGGEINLRYGLSDNVMISTDNGQYNDKSQLYMAPGFIELSNFAIGGTSQMLTNDSVSSVGGNDIRHINQYGIGGRSGFEMLSTGSGTFAFGAGIRANTGQTKSYHILAVDNSITQTSANVDILPTFISSRNSTINSGIVNSVVLGGSGLTANQSNTTYVDRLNIQTVGTGTSINNLGVDSSGNVVVGNDTDNPFTGNTSGDCINDIYVSNIHSCSPLNINPNDEGNVYFGSTSGVTVDLINKRLGINNTTPSHTLDVVAPTIGGTELIANFRVEDNPNSSLSIRNGTGTPWVMAPQVLGIQDTTFAALNVQGRGGEDTGTNGIMTFNSRIGDSVGPGSVVVTRPLFIWQNFTTEVMRIAANGNVGIGTNAPADKLHVAGTTRLISGVNGLPVAGTKTNSALIINGGATTFGTNFTVGGDGKGYIQQQRFDASGTLYPLILQPLGNSVGVATSTPTGVLTVKGSTTSANHIIFNAQNSAGDINIFDVRGSGVCYINGNSGTSQLRFRRLNSAVNATKGTMSAFDASDFVVCGINFASGAATDNSGQIIFRTASASTTTSITALPERMRINVNGNVGIARTNPTEKLDVLGNVKISNLMKLTGIASDPSTPDNGDIWHNTTTGEIRVRLGGSTFKLDVTAV